MTLVGEVKRYRQFKLINCRSQRKAYVQVMSFIYYQMEGFTQTIAKASLGKVHEKRNSLKTIRISAAKPHKKGMVILSV